MNSIRIQNMRCLKDTNTIELRPINILVGNNSSGKSTFLRLFPLMKQSFLRRINGPILWAGDDGDDVDFGSFLETVNKYAGKKEIELEFEIPFNVKNIINRIEKYSIWSTDKEKYNINKNAKLIICINNNNKTNQDYISKFFIECDGKSVFIDNIKNKRYYNNEIINVDKINQNNRKDEFYAKKYTKEINSFFNLLDENLKFNFFEEDIKDKIFLKKDKEITYFKWICNDIVSRCYAETFIKDKIKIKEFLNEFREDLEKNNSDIPDLIKKLKLQMNSVNLRNKELLDCMNIIFISEIARYCMEYLFMYFLNVNYIKPVRAHAERYYRLRNLSVDQIDSDGKNLPIFIKSLSDKELLSYNNWLYDNFGFKVEPQTTSGHVSINIKIEKQSINISDTGYGYSQLLPIITQLWVALNNKIMENIPIVFAIEQMELHLHPELQAKLIDVITKIVNSKKGKIQFILETHSETVINRIGNLIYKNKIKAENVNIVLFNKKMTDLNTEIKISKFNEEGILENWPIGFFSVSDIE